MFINSLKGAVNGFAHILEHKGIVKIIERRGQITPGIVRVQYIPARQNTRDDRMNPELFHQAVLNILVDVCHFPICSG